MVEEKGQVAEADIILNGLEETDVLMASYKNNTSQSKDWIFDSSRRFICVPKKSCSTP